MNFKNPSAFQISSSNKNFEKSFPKIFLSADPFFSNLRKFFFQENFSEFSVRIHKKNLFHEKFILIEKKKIFSQSQNFQGIPLL